MPFRYWAFYTLAGQLKVDTGECARLVQVMVPQVGHTSTWRPGERVHDVLARGGTIEPGTAVATFVNGRFPTAGHPHATPWNPQPAPRDGSVVDKGTFE